MSFAGKMRERITWDDTCCDAAASGARACSLTCTRLQPLAHGLQRAGKD